VTLEILGYYASIFIWLFATGIGIPPMPEEAGILYAAGVQALHPGVSWPFAWLACGLGILSADCVLYMMGRHWGPRLFMYRWVQKLISNERRLRIESKIHAHGMKLLVLARFLPPLRTGVFLISGASRYPFVKFLIADLAYCIVGVGLFFFAGSGLVNLIKEIGFQAAWLAVVPLVGYGLYCYCRTLKRREGPAPPVSVLQSPAGNAPEGEPKSDPLGAVAAAREAHAVLKAPALDRPI
jgi:membrane protein DedA with SNARE-associated domain